MSVTPERPLAGPSMAPPLGRAPKTRARGWAALRGLLSGSLPIVRFDPERKTLLLPNGHGALAAPRAKPRAVELRLPASAVLRKSVRLPAAAAENLRSVLALEMDRETPFAAEAVWFGHRIARRDRVSLMVDLAVVPRPLFEECMARLAAAGMVARWIAIEPLAGEPAARFAIADSGRSWIGAASLPLLGLVLALSAATLGLDLMRAQSLEQELAATRARAEQALALRRSLGDGESRRSGVPSRAALLAALADAVPDGVWLDRLRIDGKGIEISGFAQDAAALLVRLDQSGPFRDAHFIGATVRDAKTQREHFQIALTASEDMP